MYIDLVILGRWNRQGQIHETVIRRRRLRQFKKKALLVPKRPMRTQCDATRLVTSHALQPIPKLSLEKVHDDAIVAHAIDLPLLLARDLLRKFLELLFPSARHFIRRLVEDTVQVLVQPIK